MFIETTLNTYCILKQYIPTVQGYYHDQPIINVKSNYDDLPWFIDIDKWHFPANCDTRIKVYAPYFQNLLAFAPAPHSAEPLEVPYIDTKHLEAMLAKGWKFKQVVHPYLGWIGGFKQS